MEIRAASTFLSFLLFFFLFASLSCWKPAAASAFGRRSATACNQTADSGRRCGVEEEQGGEELQFDSEINRRLLAQTSGISYGALNKDKPTCSSKDGKPYNCAGKSPNPGGGRTCNVDYYRC
ncbi:protein RALF-like 1 [Zingiber officinale]|uniref:protein RALF-like 1 n=1 Tax=Zingiber officinale TaxID=94328 RepID=UPI001C4D0A6E|nr:protein RALF-like 1 [Zingiber officinale]